MEEISAKNNLSIPNVQSGQICLNINQTSISIGMAPSNHIKISIVMSRKRIFSVLRTFANTFPMVRLTEYTKKNPRIESSFFLIIIGFGTNSKINVG